MLAGKRLLLTGVATPESIAAAVARRCQDHGAELILSAYPRDLDGVRAVADTMPAVTSVVPLDVSDGSDVAAVAERLRREAGPIDGALHAVAFAPSDALQGRLRDADPAGIELAFRTSAWSFSALGSLLEATAPPAGASLVGLDFDADDRAWPTYNWMGVCKAALRSSARYLARDLGPQHIRVNLVAAGPLATRAASAIPGFSLLTDAWASTAPMPWDPHDPGPVADATCFLLSDLARAITGEVLHVDAGFHAMATPRPG